MSASGIVASTLYALVASFVYIAFETPATGAKKTDAQTTWGDLPVWASKIVSTAASLAWPITLGAGWFVLRARQNRIDAALETLRALDTFVDDVFIAACKRAGEHLDWLKTRAIIRDQARCFIAAATDDDRTAIAKAEHYIAYYEAFIWFECTYLFILLRSKGETFDMKTLPACLARHQRKTP